MLCKNSVCVNLIIPFLSPSSPSPSASSGVLLGSRETDGMDAGLQPKSSRSLINFNFYSVLLPTSVVPFLVDFWVVFFA